MHKKIAYLFDADLQKDHERVGFIQVRLAAPKQKKISVRKPPKKKDGDKNLHYASCSPDIQKGLRHTRTKEWQKWKQFNAGVILSDKEVRELQDQGVKVCPMQ